MLNKIIVCILLQVAALAPAIGQKHDFNWILGTDSLVGDKLSFQEYDLRIVPINKNFPFLTTNSTMSSLSGEYIFSFNSWGIHDKENGIMDNSDGLLLGDIPVLYDNFGGPFTQGSLALPSQKDTDQFLLFYWDFEEYIYAPDSPYAAPYHLYMAKIDQSGNNGLGSVVEKNIILVSDTLANAGIVAAKHANGRDWWVVVPEIVSNRYHTLLISNDSMVQSFSQSIGIVWPPFIDISSQLLFLNDGSKYLRFSDEVGLQIFDFDRCSGLFSNHRLINFDFDGGYFSGLSASRDSRFVYVSDRLNLYQYDLQNADIESSKIFIDTYNGFTNPYACDFLNPQLAPDGKIYLGTWGGCRNLHVINHPERKGLACDFRQHGINLNNFHAGGLPNNPNYRLGPIDGSPCDTLGIDNIPLAAFRYDRDSSDYLRIEFTELADYEPETWYWEFGDGDTSWQRYPVHVYDSAGAYQACLTVSNLNGSDTYCKTIQLGVSGTSSRVKTNEKLIYYAFEARRLILKNDAIEQFTLFDAAGRVVQQHSKPKDWVDVSALKNGFYFWQATDKTGKWLSGRFVKV
jgi:PKD repeat protein